MGDNAPLYDPLYGAVWRGYDGKDVPLTKVAAGHYVPTKRTKTKSLDLWLVEKLKDPEMAAAYLKEYLVDDGQGDYEELLLGALRNVAKAYGLKDRRSRDGYIVNAAEKKALAAIRAIEADELLEYVDSIATGRTDNKAREGRIMGLIAALADARAALND